MNLILFPNFIQLVLPAEFLYSLITFFFNKYLICASNSCYAAENMDSDDENYLEKKLWAKNWWSQKKIFSAQRILGQNCI